MKKKYASQLLRDQRYARCSALVSSPSPLLMDPNATMPITPNMTIIVPWAGQWMERPRELHNSHKYRNL